jgi:hypothetical protein
LASQFVKKKKKDCDQGFTHHAAAKKNRKERTSKALAARIVNISSPPWLDM